MVRSIIIFLTFLLTNVCSAQISNITQKSKINQLSLGESHEIYSEELAEKRVLNIYLPVDYRASDTERYPVIYLLDGGMDEDFIHVAGLVQFNTLPWVARIPKVILVGIVNVDRKRDFTFPTNLKTDKDKLPTAGGSHQFMSFLEKELQPYIQAKFRTSGSNTIIGESLGGLFAAEVLLTKPYLFDRYIIVSPSLWWDNGSLLTRSAPSIRKPTNVYIGVGKEELAPSASPHVMEVDANLLKEKIDSIHNNNIGLYFDYLPDENHATIAHQAIFNAFKQVYLPSKK